jgi:hypothetical protein
MNQAPSSLPNGASVAGISFWQASSPSHPCCNRHDRIPAAESGGIGVACPSAARDLRPWPVPGLAALLAETARAQPNLVYAKTHFENK